ncbi:MAG TPA: AAA family ATPase [Xanthomonadaceae bacterium]|jgi:predicted kinase|nr:AAA family ATPase [Xanthomonadaceae bacterium]
MPTIHLIEGPVGAGKSTFATSLAQRQSGVHIALDEWFAALFSKDRPATHFVPWYIERKDRCAEVIWIAARRIAAAGTDVVLELGLIQRQSREAFYERAEASGLSLSVYVLDAQREVRRERVRRRNEEKGHTFSMVVPDHVFDIASDMWEPPDEDEIRMRAIHCVTTDETHCVDGDA